MAWKHWAALGAALACAAGPAAADDLYWRTSPGVTFYVSVPLGAGAPRDKTPAFGMMVRGDRDYHVVNVDTRMLNFLGTGIEAKFVIAGLVAAGATVAVVSKDKKTEESYAQQQQQQAQQSSCPKTPSCP